VTAQPGSSSRPARKGATLFGLVRLRLGITLASWFHQPLWYLVLMGLVFLGILRSSLAVFSNLKGALEIEQWHVLGGVAILVSYVLLFQGSIIASSRHRQPPPVTPFALLPIPVRWGYYLDVAENASSNPFPILTLLPVCLAYAMCEEKWIGSVLTVLILMPFLTVLASGVSVLAGRIARRTIGASWIDRFQILVVLATIAAPLIIDWTPMIELATLREHSVLTSGPLPLHQLCLFLGVPDMLSGTSGVTPLDLPCVVAQAIRLGSHGFLHVLFISSSSLVALMILGRISDHWSNEIVAPVESKVIRRDFLMERVKRILPQSIDGVLASFEIEMTLTSRLIASASFQGIGVLILYFLAYDDWLSSCRFTTWLVGHSMLFSMLFGYLSLQFVRAPEGRVLLRSLPVSSPVLARARIPATITLLIIMMTPANAYLAHHAKFGSWIQMLAFGIFLGCFIMFGALIMTGVNLIISRNEDIPIDVLRIVCTLFLVFSSLAPLGFAVGCESIINSTGWILATCLVTAGLWQRGLARMEYERRPPMGKEPEHLLGDLIVGGLVVQTGLSLPLFIIDVEEFSPGQLVVGMILLFQAVSIVLSLCLLAFRKRRFNEPIDILKPGKGQFLGFGLGVMTSVMALGYLWILTQQSWFQTQVSSTSLEPVLLAGRSDALRAVGIFVIIALLAPLAEELVFRRLLFVALRRETDSFMLSAVISSLCFSLLHPNAAFPVVFTIGMVSCFLVSRFRSIGPSLAMHSTHNAIFVGILVARSIG